MAARVAPATVLLLVRCGPLSAAVHEGARLKREAVRGTRAHEFKRLICVTGHTPESYPFCVMQSSTL